jgi:hypothetical protein
MTPSLLRPHLVPAVVVFSALLLAACAREEPATLRSETRELTGFNAIELEGAASVDVTVGGPHAVEVEAPPRVLERIETEVKGDTLVIRTRLRDWISTTGTSRVAFRIAMPELVSLRVGGGNDVHLHGFAGGTSSIRSEGAAQIRATGTLDTLTVHMAGAGDGDFRALTAAHARVSVDGVGNVIVNATESLDATMNGVGTIHYLGEPSRVQTHMNGLGRIARLEDRDEDASSDADDRQALPPPAPAPAETAESTEVI